MIYTFDKLQSSHGDYHNENKIKQDLLGQALYLSLRTRQIYSMHCLTAWWSSVRPVDVNNIEK